MADLNYLRVENDEVKGSYGSSIKRSDLTNVTHSKSWEGTGKKQPSFFGYGLVFFSIIGLLIIQSTTPAERATWPLYQTFGSFSIVIVLMAIGAGIYLVSRKRKLNKLVPDIEIIVSGNGRHVAVLATSDSEWASTAAEKLKAARDPGTGNWEFIASEKRITQI